MKDADIMIVRKLEQKILLFAVSVIISFIITVGLWCEYDGSYFTYDEDNPPAVFFFPADKARWDGSKITVREWYMLTDYQKERFINEYLGEMRKNYSSPLEVVSTDYMRALNMFSSFSNEKAAAEPTTRIIDKLLAGQGKMEPGSEGTTAPR